MLLETEIEGNEKYFIDKSVSRSVVSYFLPTPWTVAHQAPLPMEFSRQEYWCGLPFSSPGDLPNPGNKPRSCAFQADSLPPEPPGKPLFQNKNNKSQTKSRAVK